ncbi:MAG: glycosyltransferase [Bacteroidetes bacterium]|nr:glycosyltransferase [Bacteroidota bacterium]
MPNEKKHLGGLPNVAAASINELYEKSQTFISAGKNDEAINVLQEILSLDPVNQKALNDLAVLYSLKGRLSESIALLNRLLQIEPANAIAGKNLGSLYLRANKVENALNSYYQVLQSSPNDTDALLAIADICLALGKTKEAVTFYQKVLNTDPQNVQATSRLVVIQQDFLDKLNNSGIPADIADTKTTGPTVSLSKEEEHRIRIGSPLPGAADGIADWGEFTVKELYDKAQLLIGEGKYEEAKETLKRALEIEPNDSSCLNDLAVLCSISKQNNTAIELLRRLLELEPINSVGRKNLGNLYLQENNLEEGLRTYSEVLKTVPNDVESLLTIARICLALNKPEDANLFFGKVLTTTQDPELLRQTLLELEKIEFNQSQDASRMLTSSLPADSGGRNANGDRPLPLVSIILLVYNKLGFSKRCIESILATVNYSNYEIVVTDNASTDGTYEYMSELANRLEKVRYVRNDSNLGFVGGCNTGVANARGEYVILLNNDTIVNKGWLESLVEFAMKTPDCGAVGSKLIYPDGRLQEAGGIIFSDGNGWNYGRGMSPYDPKYNFVREVDYISGASLMVRKDLWDEIGGLDDRFSPAYFEDSDLCFEVRKHGYKVYYEPKSSIIHFEGTTNGTDVNTGRKRYQIINRPKFVEKWEKELSEHYPNDPRIVEKASSRGIIGRIFVTDPSLPMFDRAAGSLHLFNILKALRALKYHVTFVAGNWSNKEYYKPLLEELGIETYAGDPDMMAFLGLSAPYKKIDYARLFEEREFDYAIVDFWYHAEYYVPFIRKYSSKTTIIIDTEDVHFVREIREAKVKGNRELEKLAIENKKRELAVYKKADRIWAVTEEDKKALKKENLHVPVDIRPVIHELPLVKNGFDDRSGILFVGNFNHRPNIDAIEFFSKEVFPIVAKSLPGVTLNVVGNNPGEKVRTLASDNILIRGYVRDLSQYYGNCRVCVAPLRYGAGLKGKVVEALSYGVPMVTTSIGIEGMGLHDRSEVMVADDPNEMADKIVQVYSNKEVWEQISARGRAAMEKTWSFDAGKKSLEELLLLPEKHEMENEQKLTSIVILTYNQLDYTKITIDSLRRHTKSPYEIIVVDNASSDGTVEYLKAQKDIRAIFNEENLGFPAGCNQGIEIAKGDYIVLLNNDVVVTNDWLEGLIECSEADTRVGIVGPMTNWISGFQLEKNISYKKVSQMPAFAGKYRRKNRKRWIEVPRIAGFCMLIKREVVEKIGGLDTIFGIGNCEDDDFCLRSKLAGFKVALAGDVFIHHFGSKSFSQRGIDTYLDVVSSKEKIFQEKWGITPSEWWRDGKSITKTSKLFIPVTGVEPVPVPVQP